MEVRSYNETQQSYETIKHRMEQLANGDNTASFEFELQEQGKYRLLFWADYVATQATKAARVIGVSATSGTLKETSTFLPSSNAFNSSSCCVHAANRQSNVQKNIVILFILLSI